jgi:hypothetical protein
MRQVADPGLPLDTARDADDAQLAIYRRLGGSERIAIAVRLTTLTRDATLAGIRRRHPAYDERQATRALHRLLLGDDLMWRVYPADDLVEP